MSAYWFESILLPLIAPGESVVIVASKLRQKFLCECIYPDASERKEERSLLDAGLYNCIACNNCNTSVWYTEFTTRIELVYWKHKLWYLQTL